MRTNFVQFLILIVGATRACLALIRLANRSSQKRKIGNRPLQCVIHVPPQL
jgi:hypothetical protein